MNSINIADLLLGVNPGETAGAGVPAAPGKTSEGCADVFSAILAQRRLSGLFQGGEPIDGGAATAAENLPRAETAPTDIQQPKLPGEDETSSELAATQPWPVALQTVQLVPAAGSNPQLNGEEATVSTEEIEPVPETQTQIPDRGLPSSVSCKTGIPAGFATEETSGGMSFSNLSPMPFSQDQKILPADEPRVFTRPGRVLEEPGFSAPETPAVEPSVNGETGGRVTEEKTFNRPVVEPFPRQTVLETSPAGSSVQLKLAQSTGPAVEQPVLTAQAEMDVPVPSAIALTSTVVPNVDKGARQAGNKTLPADHESSGVLPETSVETGTTGGAEAKPAPVTTILNSRFNPDGLPAGKQIDSTENPAGRGQIIELETVSTTDATTTPTGSLIHHTVPGNETPRAEIITVASGKDDIGPAVGREVNRFVDTLDGRDGTHHARVRIHPPELGAVSINVVVHGKAIELEMMVDNRDVKMLLDRHADGLRTDLGDKGFTLGNFNVSTSDGGRTHQDPGGVGQQYRGQLESNGNRGLEFVDSRFANQILTETRVNMLA